MRPSETVAVLAGAAAAASGALALLVVALDSPGALLRLLLFANVLVVAGVAGIVLAFYAADRAVRGGGVDRLLAVGDVLMTPALLFGALLAHGAGSGSGDLAGMLTHLGLGGALVSLLCWVYARVSAA